VRRSGALGGVCAALLAVGCLHPGSVQRAYEGDVVEGRFIEPDAYASYLRGAIAQAQGHAPDAIAAYMLAAHLDPASPEPWTRIAEVRCAADARGEAAEAERDVSHALDLDPGYARAWVARARCAEARGDVATQRDAAARAVALDPAGDGANVLLARAAGASGAAVAGEGAPVASVREALVALTVTARDPAIAWSALAQWAEAHGDVALWSRALVELTRAAPERRDALAHAAEELAGVGYVPEARAVAAAALEASQVPLPASLPLAARLAVDHAIARRDGAAVRRLATRGRLSLDEAAGRAVLAGEPALARDLAAPLAAADPRALGARLVLAVVDGRDLVGASRPTGAEAPASSAALVAFAAAALREGASPEMRARLVALPRAPIVAGDDRVVRAAVDLVSRGGLPAAALPPDGLVELAVVDGSASLPAAAPDDPRLDPRHRYLALALSHPETAAVRELGQRLRAVAGVDPVVAVAAATLLLASPAPVAPDVPRALLARNPADPLLAAAALRLAERAGDTDVARRARATLSALGQVPRRVD